jgi:hypothetical protein
MQRYNFFANRQRIPEKIFKKHAFFIIVLTRIKAFSRYTALSDALRTLKVTVTHGKKLSYQEHEIV